MGLTWENGRSLVDLVDEMIEAMDDVPRRVVEAVGEELLEEVRRRTPVDTGEIKRGWYRTPVEPSEDGGLRTTVANREWKAILVEVDVKPHLIGPKEEEALRIPEGGAIRVRAGAEHPGTQGQHPMRDALAAIEVRWQEIARRELDKVIRERGLA